MFGWTFYLVELVDHVYLILSVKIISNTRGVKKKKKRRGLSTKKKFQQ
jgi:hypothetical protein